MVSDSSLTTPFYPDLLQRLSDRNYAAAYLNEILRDGDIEEFLIAIRDVAEAQGGMAAVAERAQIPRPSAYRMVSRSGNPSIRNTQILLEAMNLRLSILPCSPEKQPIC